MTDFENLLAAVNAGNLLEVERILTNPGHSDLLNQRDSEGATALHFAAFAGHSDIARALIKKGADVNARDARFQATPAGWAIEYLREMGGLLGIELNDFAYAIDKGDVDWVKRFLTRFPALREARDAEGTPFKDRARKSGRQEIAALFS